MLDTHEFNSTLSYIKINVFLKYHAPAGNKVQKAIIAQSTVIVTRLLTLLVICYWCPLKGHHWLSMNAKYEVTIFYHSSVIAKVIFDKRQTDKQTGQKQYAPII